MLLHSISKYGSNIYPGERSTSSTSTNQPTWDTLLSCIISFSLTRRRKETFIIVRFFLPRALRYLFHPHTGGSEHSKGKEKGRMDHNGTKERKREQDMLEIIMMMRRREKWWEWWSFWHAKMMMVEPGGGENDGLSTPDIMNSITHESNNGSPHSLISLLPFGSL